MDRAIAGGKKRGRGKFDPSAAVTAVLNQQLTQRRETWLERLVYTALWLKSAAKPPLPWHRMFHVAEALADQEIPLKEIPLMLSIAERSVAAYLGRLQERG